MQYHLDDTELYFFNEGLSTAAYQALGVHSRLGAHGERVYRFAVWAPEAMAVSVVGDFNAWNPQADPMRPVGTTGVWEAHLGLVNEGQFYKYAIVTRSGEVVYRADPYAVRAERGGTASMVAELPDFEWTDDAYFDDVDIGMDAPVSIYEVHLGSWKKNRTYRQLADELIDYVCDMGYTHVELMPLTEYPYDPSWGYQTTGYYAATSRYGTPEDLMYFVNRAHVRGIGVIMDWVPAHFPQDDHGLRMFDGSCCYEHFDPARRSMPRWGTFLFNFDRTQVHSFLLSSAIFWLKEYHMDGLRLSTLSAMIYRDYAKEHGEWVPNRFGSNEDTGAIEFLRKLNKAVSKLPQRKLMLAEMEKSITGVTHDVRDGGLGFRYKWNTDWMQDILAYMEAEPFFRKWKHNLLTFPLSYAFMENHVLPLPHDEVVHGKHSLISKMPGEYAQKFAQLRLLFALQFAHPGKKLMFMGDEFAQFNEWRFDSQLDWNLLEYEAHGTVQAMVRDLNNLYRMVPALHEVDGNWQGFRWLQPDDSRHSVAAWMRLARDGSSVVCVFNCSPVNWRGYAIGVPESGTYEEILNTDSVRYGGTGSFMNGTVESVDAPLGGFGERLSLNLAPFSAVYLRLLPRD